MDNTINISLGDFVPSLKGDITTDAEVITQGYEYNQEGLEYNSPNVLYGGLSNQNEYVIPMVSLANYPYPSIYNYFDFYTQHAVPHGTIQQGQSYGPGFLMFITYSNQVKW